MNQLKYNLKSMRYIQIISYLLLSMLFSLCHCIKPMKALHPSRRLAVTPSNNESHNFKKRIGKKSERKLNLFGPSEIEKEMDDTTEHSQMVLTMEIADKNGKINKIVKSVKEFRSAMDDLHETLGMDISHLNSVAQNQMDKPNIFGYSI